MYLGQIIQNDHVKLVRGRWQMTPGIFDSNSCTPLLLIRWTRPICPHGQIRSMAGSRRSAAVRAFPGQYQADGGAILTPATSSTALNFAAPAAFGSEPSKTTSENAPPLRHRSSPLSPPLLFHKGSTLLSSTHSQLPIMTPTSFSP